MDSLTLRKFKTSYTSSTVLYELYPGGRNNAIPSSKKYYCTKIRNNRIRISTMLLKGLKIINVGLKK